jgi:hypothetical protein
MKVCPFPNIGSSNHEITGCNQLTIIWTRNTDKGRTKNGIKCKRHTDRNKRENKIKCKRHNNKGRIGNGSNEEDTLIELPKNKIRCIRNNINHKRMHKKIN